MKWIPLTQNPWDAIPSRPPFILEMDQEAIMKHNVKWKSKPHKLVMEAECGCIPCPFAGDPRTAPVILLNTNPRHVDRNRSLHTGASFRKAALANLRHDAASGNFLLTEEFKCTPGGNYWRVHLRELIAATSIELVSRNVAMIEWCPYHTEKDAFISDGLFCPSQQYSWNLAVNAHTHGREVIVLRSKYKWKHVNLGFEDSPSLFSRRPWVTRNNLPDGVFDRMIERIRRGN